LTDISSYSRAIAIADNIADEQTARLNRALVNMKLFRFEAAVLDASSCQLEKLKEKALYRQAKSLYEIYKFEASQLKFEQLAELYPSNKEAAPEIKRTMARLREQNTGEYNFRKMYEDSQRSPPLIDCATHIGSIKIKASPGRGNGLFTTANVKAGDLLLCEKAFEYVYTAPDDEKSQRFSKILLDLSNSKGTLGGQPDLVTNIIQKLQHNPEMAVEFGRLHSGDYECIDNSVVDGQPVVDTHVTGLLSDCIPY
jgi:hypothetical protein